MTDKPACDNQSFKSDPHTDEEMNDYDLGCRARSEGQPNDDTKTPAWQRGWADFSEIS
jgi:hypothetical protein